MKNFEIKITGSGTKNQLEISLLELVRELQTTEEKQLFYRQGAPFFEDATIYAEITEE